MVFKKREELQGEVDPNIYRGGRPGPKPEREMSRRAIKDRELVSILRKIKPHLSESIMTAASIMKNKDAAHSSQLKAAVILLNAYKELVSSVYDGDEDENKAPEVQEQHSPVFSLKMLSNEDKVD